MIDLHSLRCFVAVAETAHFAAAARRVALSPTAFSERIRRLEDDLDVVLLERTSRRVRLTEAGLRLLPHARRLLDDAARCSQVARGSEAPLPFELTLGTRYELGLSWLTPALEPLAVRRPERTLHLAMGDTEDLLHGLDRRRLDAVIFSAPDLRPHLRSAPLHEETYVFVGAPTLGWHPERVGDTRLIDVSPDLPLFRYLSDTGRADGWRFGRYQYMGGIGGIRSRVVEGAGVAVLPRYFVTPDLQAGRLVDLLPGVPLGTDWFRLVWRADHPREAELVVLAGELRERPLR